MTKNVNLLVHFRQRRQRMRGTLQQTLQRLLATSAFARPISDQCDVMLGGFGVHRAVEGGRRGEHQVEYLENRECTNRTMKLDRNNASQTC